MTPGRSTDRPSSTASAPAPSGGTKTSPSGGLVLDMSHPILPVRDLEESVKFYRDVLGFRLVDREHEPCCDRVTMTVGSGTLILMETAEFTPIGLGPHGLDSPFHLHVEDFRAAADRLEKLGVRVRRTGNHAGTIFDPSGNAIGLREGPSGHDVERHSS